MKSLAQSQKWFKTLTLTRKDHVHVGLDVHKHSIAMAIWINDHIAREFTTPIDIPLLIERLQQVKPALRKVVYEAGPTGFGLARALQKAGLPVEVISAADTPQPRKRKSKTDRLDCRDLAKHSAQGNLHPVAIPTAREEEDRQLPRLRDQLVKKRKRIKQQIKSFLLQHGIAEPDGLQGWTLSSLAQLEELALSFSLRITLDTYLQELHQYNRHVNRINTVLRELARKPRHQRVLTLLTSHPGVGDYTAWAFHTEVFRPGRFTTASEIAGFIGLSPQIRQSGQTKREGPITKTGRGSLRSKLIEASWRWIKDDPAARKDYARLRRNTGNKNKAIVALARRLAIHLWKMSCTKQAYRAPAVSS